MNVNEYIFDTEELANDIKDTIAEGIISSGHSATGKAVNSLEVREYEDGYIILAVPYLNNIQTGTPPNRSRKVNIGKSGFVTAPEFALARKLKDGWLQSRGLSNDLAYPIARKIVNEGTETYRKGGEDIWDSEVNNILNNLDKYIKIDI